MSYRDQPFAKRIGVLGDQAEAAYERTLPLGNSIRFGWDRPSVSMKNMAEAIKHLPDYYAGAGYLVEVVGCGRDLTLKFRESKVAALDTWHKIQPVYVFIYNSFLKEYALIDWRRFKRVWSDATRAYGVQEFSSDGNRYVPIPFEWLKERGDWGLVDDEA